MLRAIIHFLVWFTGHMNRILHIPMWLYFQLQSPKRCPPVYDDVYLQPAIVIADRIRNQKLKSVYVVSMYIDRAKEVNKVLNAIVTERFKVAMNEAQHADDFVRNSGLNTKELEERYPLLGVPVSVKECIAVQGMSWGVGSKIRPRIATQDAKAVEMLKASGAIIYLVTNTPELCMNWECMNYATGRTLNPYDTRRSAGGSSGGEAALIAACGSLIGIGSDMIGSGRGPPSFCGVYGHRTSSNLTPIELHSPYIQHHALSLSPITRYAVDLPLVLKCIVPPEKIEEIKLFEEFDAKTIRVFYMFGSGSNYPTTKVSSEIVAAMKKVVTHLEDDGFFTKNVQLKSFADQFDIAYINLLSMKGAYEEMSYKNISLFVEWIRTIFCSPRIVLSILLFEMLYFFSKILGSEEVFERHKILLKEMKKEVEEMLGDDGVLLYPTFPSVAPVHGLIYAKTMDPCYMGIFNALDLTSCVVPIGKNSNGLPIGIQVVAKQLNDRVPMKLARYLETTYGGWTPPEYSTPHKK